VSAVVSVVRSRTSDFFECVVCVLGFFFLENEHVSYERVPVDALSLSLGRGARFCSSGRIAARDILLAKVDVRDKDSRTIDTYLVFGSVQQSSHHVYYCAGLGRCGVCATTSGREQTQHEVGVY